MFESRLIRANRTPTAPERSIANIMADEVLGRAKLQLSRTASTRQRLAGRLALPQVR